MTIRLTRRQYERKTAYQIDPVLHGTVLVDGEPVVTNPRCEHEEDYSTWRRIFERARRNPSPFIAALAVFALAAGVVGFAASTGKATAAPTAITVDHGDQSLAVAAVQQRLASYGYSVVDDGIFGPQTLRAVQHFQLVSGLFVDGIVGKNTQRALGLRLEGGGTISPPSPSPVGSGGGGGRCPQWHALLQANGMPISFFDPVMYRESRCNPNAYNGSGRDRSYGLVQINTYGSLWGELARRCGLSTPEQLFDPATNIACAADLYRTYGTRPWT